METSALEASPRTFFSSSASSKEEEEEEEDEEDEEASSATRDLMIETQAALPMSLDAWGLLFAPNHEASLREARCVGPALAMDPDTLVTTWAQ